MHIRVDPVAGDAPIRLIRVESIQPQGRDADQEQQEHAPEEPAATYATAPQEDTGAYAPGPDAFTNQPLLPPSPAAVLAVLKPVAAPDEEERSLFPSGTPAWISALLKA
jgi:hypothetical protein